MAARQPHLRIHTSVPKVNHFLNRSTSKDKITAFFLSFDSQTLHPPRGALSSAFLQLPKSRAFLWQPGCYSFQICIKQCLGYWLFFSSCANSLWKPIIIYHLATVLLYCYCMNHTYLGILVCAHHRLHLPCVYLLTFSKALGLCPLSPIFLNSYCHFTEGWNLWQTQSRDWIVFSKAGARNYSPQVRIAVCFQDKVIMVFISVCLWLACHIGKGQSFS